MSKAFYLESFYSFPSTILMKLGLIEVAVPERSSRKMIKYIERVTDLAMIMKVGLEN